MIFTLSLDEIAVTFFLIGRDNTLPLEIWSRLRRGITPEINAISTLILLFSIATILIWYRLRTRTQQRRRCPNGDNLVAFISRRRKFMTDSRRDFLKFIVVGSMAAGCPVDLSLLAAEDSPAPQVDGDHFEICHQVRDGHTFAKPPVSKRHDVVIVGGGVSGLSAAYFLQGHDFLLLEKEAHWGGNATMEEYEGQPFCTGSAFDYTGTASDHLARELGLAPLPINCADPTIVNGKWVADTWGAGLDELPYPASVRESFKKFRKDMLVLANDKNQEQFDNTPLSKYLKSYAPEVKLWWDTYGPSNYGATSDDTSTMVALDELRDMAGAAEHDSRITLPGGNATLAQKLAQTLQVKSADRMIAGATIVSVDPQKTEVHVTYMQDKRVAHRCRKIRSNGYTEVHHLKNRVRAFPTIKRTR